MKSKLLPIVLISLTTFFVACAEEEVKPDLQYQVVSGEGNEKNDSGF